MDKTWKPTVAGILQLVSGTTGLIAVFGMVIAIIITGNFVISGIEDVPILAPALLTSIAIPLAIISILSLIGGLPVGITATILTALSKQEFEQQVLARESAIQ